MDHLSFLTQDEETIQYLHKDYHYVKYNPPLVDRTKLIPAGQEGVAAGVAGEVLEEDGIEEEVEPVGVESLAAGVAGEVLEEDGIEEEVEPVGAKSVAAGVAGEVLDEDGIEEEVEPVGAELVAAGVAGEVGRPSMAKNLQIPPSNKIRLWKYPPATR